jgi:hypothetical protein
MPVESMASDRGHIATLTTSNIKLDLQLKTAQAYITKHKEYIFAFKANIKPAWQGQCPTKSTSDYTHCWSHGYQVHKDHTIATCKARKDGHKDSATKYNLMGGVKWVITVAEGQLRL